MRFYQRIIANGLILTGFTGLFGCGNKLNQLGNPKEEEQSSLEVKYFNFSKFTLLDIPLTKMKISRLEYLIEEIWNYSAEVSDSERFNQEVLETAENLGFTKSKISLLKSHELIKLSADIVGQKLTYHNVDEDPVFIKKHGAHLSDDLYFYLGKGDCDKYADLTVLVYDLLKKINSNPTSQNVYLTRDIGGRMPMHAWNSVIVMLSQNKVRCSHIDPTFADNNGKLEATPRHVNSNYFPFKFQAMYGDYNKSNQLIDNLLVKEYNKNKKAFLLSYKADNYNSLEQKLKAAKLYEEAETLTDSNYLKSVYIDDACNLYFTEEKHGKVIELMMLAKNQNLANTMWYPSILATAINSCREIDDDELENKLLDELLTNYPDSAYAKGFK